MSKNLNLTQALPHASDGSPLARATRLPPPSRFQVARVLYGAAFEPTTHREIGRSMNEWLTLALGEQSFALGHLLYLNLQAQAGTQKILRGIYQLLEDVNDAVQALADGLERDDEVDPDVEGNDEWNRRWEEIEDTAADSIEQAAWDRILDTAGGWAQNAVGDKTGETTEDHSNEKGGGKGLSADHAGTEDVRFEAGRNVSPPPGGIAVPPASLSIDACETNSGADLRAADVGQRAVGADLRAASADLPEGSGERHETGTASQVIGAGRQEEGEKR